MTDTPDIERLAQQIADHLGGETTIALDYEDGLRVTDLGDVVTSLAEAQLAQVCDLGELSEQEVRARVEAVSALCRDLVGDGEQPAPVRVLAVRVLAVLSGSDD